MGDRPRHLEADRIADPAIVRASWDPEAALEGRVLHLEISSFLELKTVWHPMGQ